MGRNRAAYDRARREEKYEAFQAWMEFLKADPCLDCGGRFTRACMDWDHVRGEKKFNVGRGDVRSRRDLCDEILKCDLVCANCHRIRTEVRRGTACS